MEVSNKIDRGLYHRVFLQNCIGDSLIFIDLEESSADDFSKMLDKAGEYDIVIGVRKRKIQNLFQRFISYWFYQFIRLFYHRNIKENYSDFCILNRKVIHYLLKENIDIYFLRLVQFDLCFSKFEYIFEPLKKSKKINFLDSIGLGIDIVIQNSYRALRLATILSLFVSLFNLIYLFYAVGSYFLNRNLMGGWTSTSVYLVIINLFLFLILAILGEYLRIILIRSRHSNLHEIVEEKGEFSLCVNDKNIRHN